MSKNFIFLFAFLPIFLWACNVDDSKWIISKKQAVKDATNLDPQVYQAYFQCYALDIKSKKDCLKQLNDQYINNKFKVDLHYQQSFQYQAEKLGFMKFLRDNNLPCEGLDYGPKFLQSVNAYHVICTCNNSFLLQFDYMNKQWHLKENID